MFQNKRDIETDNLSLSFALKQPLKFSNSTLASEIFKFNTHLLMLLSQQIVYSLHWIKCA